MRTFKVVFTMVTEDDRPPVESVNDLKKRIENGKLKKKFMRKFSELGLIDVTIQFKEIP